MAKSNRKLAALAPVVPLKLDFGCGPNKVPGFSGVDAIAFDGVDHVLDVTKDEWPWGPDSVSEVHSSHFIEHLTWPERVAFFNKLWIVMKVDAQARIITPHPTNDCYYGDPTHKEPLGSWYRVYLFKPWRDANAPHAPYTCNFDSTDGIAWDVNDREVMLWSEERKNFGAKHYRNVARDLHVILTKKPLTMTPPA